MGGEGKVSMSYEYEVQRYYGNDLVGLAGRGVLRRVRRLECWMYIEAQLGAENVLKFWARL